MSDIEEALPPMPAHEWALQWARDTRSGPASGQRPFRWGDRNLAASYVALHTEVAALRRALRTLERYASLEAMDRFVFHEKNKRIIGWEKTSKFKDILSAARAALGQP